MADFQIGQLVEVKTLKMVGAVLGTSADWRLVSVELSKAGRAFVVKLPPRELKAITVSSKTLYPDGRSQLRKETLGR